LKTPRETRSLEGLKKIQEELAGKILLKDGFRKPVQRVAAVDLAYNRDEAFAAAIVYDYLDARVLEEHVIREALTFPYIPGFLAFREAPPITEAVKGLRTGFQILLLNAHGTAHPRGCGCASHVGLLLKKPTVGVALRKLCGEYAEKPLKAGDWRPLIYRGKTVGSALLSKPNCNPIIVSPGNLVTLESSITIVKHLLKGHKLPEPLRLAHNLANACRAEGLKGSTDR